ncbi:MAG: glutaredoxin 3 [Gammaproteobacteria bacterium]|nr:glutaredoxin 3 [Gammaproteobacteria bacterium]MCW8958637.1 glutaredoxin 3 [Gammaproteobacteria bacterium]MCW8971981.1 glutaredoxin 3 [Gammaproteobacteria bacterium]MCW8991979.1 glutaredoxin 3 [Gammaproteobacteria bacterium]MCW9087989.1 glutaredoxin 3 [Gammaproteobacteria bacterium]
MPNVVMYTTASCPFCVRARSLLDKKGVEYTDIRIDNQPDLRPEMEEKADGRTSVPQIFIDDYHVGGFDELSELDIDGELDKRLGL